MTDASISSANVQRAVPFFWVTNMDASLRFYVEGLGFTLARWWIPDQPGEYEPDGDHPPSSFPRWDSLL